MCLFTSSRQSFQYVIIVIYPVAPVSDWDLCCENQLPGSYSNENCQHEMYAESCVTISRLSTAAANADVLADSRTTKLS